MHRNPIKSFTIYRLASRAYFHLPIILLLGFFLTNSILYSIIPVIIYALISTIASMLIRGKTFLSAPQQLFFGEVLKFLGVISGIGAAWMSSYPLLILMQVLTGIGFSLSAVADSRTFKIISKTFTIDPTYQSSVQSRMFQVNLLAGILGGVSFLYMRPAPFILSSIACATSIVAVIFLAHGLGAREEARNHNQGSQITKYLKHLKYTDISDDAKTKRSEQSQNLRAIANTYSISRGLILGMSVGVFPLVYISAHGINFFLMIMSHVMFNLMATMSAKRSKQLANAFKNLRKQLYFWLATLACISVAIVGIGQGTVVSVMGAGLAGLVSGTLRPLAMETLLENKSFDDAFITLVAAKMEKNSGFVNLCVIGAFAILSIVWYSTWSICVVAGMCFAFIAIQHSATGAISRR